VIEYADPPPSSPGRAEGARPGDPSSTKEMDGRVKPGHDDKKKNRQNPDTRAGGRILFLVVMAGLDPAIHLFCRRWITGSRAFSAAR